MVRRRFPYTRGGSQVSQDFTIFASTANPALSGAVARELGLSESACSIDRFPDGEVEVQLSRSVRRKEVCLLLQATSPPVNDHLVELLALADAFRRAGAR